ncbi:hypothetical protein CHCC20335_2030 [Bacillus paralicheniformis]|nr:hypothetical protein CHCC20335_2030 [Bacillus paralicheniformis]
MKIAVYLSYYWECHDEQSHHCGAALPFHVDETLHKGKRKRVLPKEADEITGKINRYEQFFKKKI